MSGTAQSKRKFLVVVDDTPECKVAVRYAARRAQHTGGIVTLLHVILPSDFQHFMAVERVMREEAERAAEGILHSAAQTVYDLTGARPELVVREGDKAETVLNLLKEDKDISILVLAAGLEKEGPGPLVAMVASEAAHAYPIPVTVVPGSLSETEIDALA